MLCVCSAYNNILLSASYEIIPPLQVTSCHDHCYLYLAIFSSHCYFLVHVSEHKSVAVCMRVHMYMLYNYS